MCTGDPPSARAICLEAHGNDVSLHGEAFEIRHTDSAEGLQWVHAADGRPALFHRCKRPPGPHDGQGLFHSVLG